MSMVPSRSRFEGSRIIVVMGVTSSGKSAVGSAIARRLHAPFLDGDGYHPDANIAKMSAGIPLTDEDRWPWLTRLAEALADSAKAKGVAVGACSALKRAYRDFITARAGQPVLFVYLEGSRDTIAARMQERQHHFMPTSLLDSQFATLEPPAPDENALAVSISASVESIASSVVTKLAHLRSFKRKQ